MLKKYVSVLLLALALCGLGQAYAAQPVSIFPQPKDVEFLSQTPLPLESASGAIILSSKASEPEQYAAETLQKIIKRRYDLSWPILRDNANLKAFKALVILGQASNNKLLSAACHDLNINPSENFPIQDGYALGIGSSGGKTVAVVAGSNPRSVIFGQDTLFQLLGKQNGKAVIWPAKIRDWPSMPYRGRVNTGTAQFGTVEAMDAVAQARLNFIDVRQGKYGTEPKTIIETDITKWVIKEAHRRGLLVYATVYIGVQPPEYDLAIAKFQEFIDLGVDGLWPYLGDPGGEYRTGTPLELIRRILELGKEHGMTGDLIHFTPGKKGYITIATNDNFAAAKVPGMADALWFFAQKPTAESYADAKKLGLKKKYMWWYHWPRPTAGFTYAGNVGMRIDHPNIYCDVTPMNEAYQSPTPQELAKATDYIDGAIPWGGTAWLPEAIAGVLGWWTWSPETFDWQQVRRRMYDYIYGPDMVDTAFEFTNLLGDLRSKLTCGDESLTGDFVWPPVLKNESDRAICQDILKKMYAPLDKLEKGAAKGTMLSKERLDKYFFEPMRGDMEAGKIVMDLPRPELWWQANQDRILMAIREGNGAQALRWQADAQKRVPEDLEKTKAMMTGVISPFVLGHDWTGEFEKHAGQAIAATSPITLDGELNEAAWSTAPKIAPFMMPKNDGTAEDASEVQFIYSADALYIGATLFESVMGKLTANLTGHDSEIWNDDSFEIFLNTDGFGMPYYHFVANTLGTKYEQIVISESDMNDQSWNGDWDVKIAKKSDRWTAEVRIPYTTIGVSKIEKDTMWLCNFARHDTATNRPITKERAFQETSAWGYATRGPLHDPSKFRPVWFK